MFKKISKLRSKHQVCFAIVIGIAVVAFWRGTWGLMDLYIFPGNHELSVWLSFIGGLFILGITHYITKKL